jgi:hypothetical protein
MVDSANSFISLEAAMAEDKASELKGCDEEVPLLGVTREFDFGQFIELFDDSPDPSNPSAPPSISRIVIQPTSQLASDRVGAQGGTASTSSAMTAAGAVSEVHLFDLTENGPAAKRAPAPVEIKDAASFFASGAVSAGGRVYKVSLSEADKESLRTGVPVTVFGTAEGGGGKAALRLSLPVEAVKLTEGGLAGVLAGQPVDTSAGTLKPALTPSAIRSLLAGGEVLTHGLAADGSKTPLSLHPARATPEPLSNRLEVSDLAAFIADPSVPSKAGGRLPLTLTAEHVQQLISGGRTRLQAGSHAVDLAVSTASSSGAAQGVTVVGGSGGPVPATVAPQNMTDKVQPRLPTGTGLPVAVFVPWKQTWSLKGFSRGNLLNTIAMAPQEQVTMQVSSWERRSRSLEQSSETETDQQTDVNQTTRDTEDVFKEMVSKRDFAWQISGSIDASYSPGVASIKVSAGGGVSETNNIVQTARRSSQSVKESTVKASSRVRSRRVTRITQTVENGREERVTRVIRNPNQAHTLTLDFFETLAHYEIKLEFMKDRLRLVVLVPNPIKVTEFVSEVIRRNETALFNALIDPALSDGFEACRYVAAYEEARRLVSAQAAEAAAVKELEAQRDRQAPVSGADPAAPQQAELERVVSQMVSALKAMKNAEVDTALRLIAQHRPVPEAKRKSGQQWLFINFCAAKFPALLSALDEIAQGSPSLVEAAQKIMAVLPKPDAPTTLSNLNQMSNGDKEGCGIASKLKQETNGIRDYMKMDWDWGWWTGRMQEEGLYTANDGGLSGLADLLQKAYAAWEAKKAQGDAMKDQDVAQAEAEGRQDKATVDDKLSMSFPLEDLAKAYERMKTLMSHLSMHRAFYNYALFQALPPSEQSLQIVQASNGRLQVGLFEPRVVAMSGDRLVVPLTPLASTSQLQSFVTNLANDLETAFQGALNTPDTTILPTPGVSVTSRLGKCTCAESYIETARRHELDRLEGLARQEQAEARRREARLEEKDLEDFRRPPPAVKLELDKN